MEKEQIEISLKYKGPDVDGGSMSIEDIVPVLQGFSSAYGKIALNADPNSQHHLRITGVKKGSANILLEVWKTLGQNADSLTGLSIVGGLGIVIVKKIMGVIAIKRHVKKQPYQESISANNGIVISNSQNVKLEIPLELFDLFKSGLIDRDINKMMLPLEKDRIDEAEISARAADGIILQEKITVEERPYFETEEVTKTTTTETWLTAKINSITKSTNGGFLYLSDGSRVYYHYVGEDAHKLYNLFAYDGVVRIRCIAKMDENLKVIELEINDIDKTQNGLFDGQEKSLT